MNMRSPTMLANPTDRSPQFMRREKRVQQALEDQQALERSFLLQMPLQALRCDCHALKLTRRRISMCPSQTQTHEAGLSIK
jgi:hypothetical protein